MSCSTNALKVGAQLAECSSVPQLCSSPRQMAAAAAAGIQSASFLAHLQTESLDYRQSELLANSHLPAARLMAAEHTSTPPDILRQLATDKDDRIAISALRNPNSPYAAAFNKMEAAGIAPAEALAVIRKQNWSAREMPRCGVCNAFMSPSRTCANAKCSAQGQVTDIDTQWATRARAGQTTKLNKVNPYGSIGYLRHSDNATRAGLIQMKWQRAQAVRLKGAWKAMIPNAVMDLSTKGYADLGGGASLRWDAAAGTFVFRPSSSALETPIPASSTGAAVRGAYRLMQQDGYAPRYVDEVTGNAIVDSPPPFRLPPAADPVPATPIPSTSTATDIKAVVAGITLGKKDAVKELSEKVGPLLTPDWQTERRAEVEAAVNALVKSPKGAAAAVFNALLASSPSPVPGLRPGTPEFAEVATRYAELSAAQRAVEARREAAGSMLGLMATEYGQSVKIGPVLVKVDSAHQRAYAKGSVLDAAFNPNLEQELPWLAAARSEQEFEAGVSITIRGQEDVPAPDYQGQSPEEVAYAWLEANNQATAYTQEMTRLREAMGVGVIAAGESTRVDNMTVTYRQPGKRTYWNGAAIHAAVQKDPDLLTTYPWLSDAVAVHDIPTAASVREELRGTTP